MPAFSDRVVCRAPAEAVWRLLHDPRRFPEWWVGTARVDMDAERPTRYLEGWPDFPMPMEVSSRTDGSRVIVSCLVSDILTEWTLEPHRDGCAVAVRVEIPEHEAARLQAMREQIGASLARLAERAAAGA
jgi:uncharacterized protein YndB with AHSA1/START domain